MTYILRFRQVDRRLFADIQSGRKSVETRAASSKYVKIVAGDSLKCVCGKDFVVKKIGKASHFPSVKALFKKVPITKVMPDAKNLAEVKRIYDSYPGYKEKIVQFGLVAFFLK